MGWTAIAPEHATVTRTGHCLCGAVRYELDGELAPLVNCHCQYCRRVSGAAFVTSMPIATRNLRVIAGEDAIARYQQRYFCGRCGTRLWNRLDQHPAATMLMVAALDDPPATEPVVHLNLESKAPWYTLRDDAPRFDAFPPDVDAALQRIERDD